MGYLGAALTQVFTRTGGADVSLRDVTISQMGNEAGECGWHHAPEARGGFWGFWKSQLVELRTRLRTGRVDFRGSLRPDEFVRYGHHTRWGSRWKSQNRKNVYLSPYVEELLNSKVIKSFVPELRSRDVFFVFRDSYVLCYICYEHSMYVSHIAVTGYGTITQNNRLTSTYVTHTYVYTCIVICIRACVYVCVCVKCDDLYIYKYTHTYVHVTIPQKNR